MSKSRKIIFIVDSLTQPRCIKRVLSFVKGGYQCSVYGYVRNKYKCNVYPDGISVTVLGEMRDGVDYYKKFKQLKQDLRRIIRDNQEKGSVYYSFGFFSTLLLFLNRLSYIYEISDVLYGYPRFSKFLWLLKAIDKQLIRKSVATVMTSEGFYGFYNLHKDNIFILPNKVNTELFTYNRQTLHMCDNPRLVFAFVGAIRYETIFRFAEVIGEFFPQHEFHFYGSAQNRALSRCRVLTDTFSNIKYYGEYVNPDDLPHIYEGIDVVVACYNPTSLNETIAEPNKLYEAMFFCRPIIVSEGLFLSQQVKKYNCGYAIDATSKQEIVNFINGLNAKDLNRISASDEQIEALELIDNPNRLLQRIDVFFKE